MTYRKKSVDVLLLEWDARDVTVIGATSFQSKEFCKLLSLIETVSDQRHLQSFRPFFLKLTSP
jgi:hypothetical protein